MKSPAYYFFLDIIAFSLTMEKPRILDISIPINMHNTQMNMYFNLRIHIFRNGYIL